MRGRIELGDLRYSIDQNINCYRANRSSSVCPVNGFPEKTGKKGLSGSLGRPASASTSELPCKDLVAFLYGFECDFCLCFLCFYL